MGRAPPNPRNDSRMASGTLIHPPKTDSTASAPRGTVMVHGASWRCFASWSPVRFAPWKVMTIIRVM